MYAEVTNMTKFRKQNTQTHMHSMLCPYMDFPEVQEALNTFIFQLLAAGLFTHSRHATPDN